MKTTDNRILVFVAMLLFGSTTSSLCQTFLGVKGGVNATNIKYNNAEYKQFYNSNFEMGYTGGLIFMMENKEKYGLYTEFLYSTRGKKVESSKNDYVTNEATYHFIDVPILFRVRFKKVKYSWFLQLGPEINYWLGGKGQFKVYEPDRDEYVTYDYKVNFGESDGSFDYLNASEANRLQLGLAFGGGMIWELKNANFISLDLRYSYGHTYMGEFENANIPNVGLIDNFEYTNNVLSASVVYYFDIMEKMRLSKNKYRRRR